MSEGRSHGRRGWRGVLVVVAVCVATGGGSPAWVRAQELPPPDPEVDALRIELPVEPGGLTGDSVAERAVEVAPQVRSAAATAAQAEESARRHHLVDFAPQLDLMASYTRLSAVDTPPLTFGGTTIDNPFQPILDNYDFQATLTVPVSDYFLTIAPGYEALQETVHLREAQEATERAAAALQAQQAFYQYVGARLGLLVADDAVAQLTAHISDLEDLFEAGVVTRAEVLQAQAALADAQSERYRLQGAIATAGTALRRLLDLDPAEPLPIGEDVMEPVVEELPDEETLLETAWANRPEVVALNQVVRVQQAALRAQRGARWPHFAVVAGSDWANPNPRIQPATEQFDLTWSLTLALSWSPNDAYRADIAADELAVQLENAQNDLAALEDGVALELADAANSYRTALAARGAAEEGVRAAQEAWRVQRDLLAADEATASDVLDAETALRRAQFAFVVAGVQARLARVRLSHALGQSAY